MISFENDYSEGAHPNLLKKLVDTNMTQESGYGLDSFSLKAVEKIKATLGLAAKSSSVRFLQGGTQTNQIIIDSMLQSYEGVIAADTGHINVHEAGAIEFTGHKVLTLLSREGKLHSEDVSRYIDTFHNDSNFEHMVFPGMVYISWPTEYGTLYSKQELIDLRKVCIQNKIPLFIDGARLGYGLMSEKCDLTIEDIAELSDVFYIGGTKIGALCGEAVVFTKNNEPDHFTTVVKQHGALMAKGRLIGIQFLELFTDNLYFEISKHAINMAHKLKQGFQEKNYKLYMDSPTNQQFFILENKKIDELSKKVKFARWEKYDDNHSVVRFVTNWASTRENIEYLLSVI
ncbi:threonine aldolase family protein [Leuconostoc falkenbergense]